MILSNYDKEKTEAEQALVIAQEALQNVVTEVAKLKKQSEEITGKIMPVESADVFGSRMASIASYADRGSSFGYSQTNFSFVVKKARQHAEELKIKADAAHQKNLTALENNKRLSEKIVLFMQAVGIPETYSEREYSGRRRQKSNWVKHGAGYIGDIHRNIVTNDGYDKACRDYEQMLKDISEYERKMQAQEDEQKRIEESQKKEEQATKDLAILIVKYGLPYESTWGDLLEHLLSKNKYLRLAHYLAENRNDWNDGYNDAEIGLRGFTVETDTDKEIYADIKDCIENWGGDGRIFRDTDWNYSRIFALVTDNGLHADYVICRNKIA